MAVSYTHLDVYKRQSESHTDMSVVKAQSEKGSILIRMLVTDSLQIVRAHQIQQGLKIEVF